MTLPRMARALQRAGTWSGPAETVTLDWMIEQIAGWIQSGGRSLGKPTHFQEREGEF